MKRGPPTPPTPFGERGEILGEVADTDTDTDAGTGTGTGTDDTDACTDPPAPGTTGRPRRGLRSRRGL
ncbi:hypothetical protein ACFWDQ_19055 [Streptomyces sp. NPDC060053]|uniref:hypothetical protein n=1 Tax=Streptomyces sp. NPDC060053 TaxID=3347047 RepID=UPI0036CC95AF